LINNKNEIIPKALRASSGTQPECLSLLYTDCSVALFEAKNGYRYILFGARNARIIYPCLTFDMTMMR